MSLLKYIPVLNATNLNVIVLALYGSATSTSILGSLWMSFASVSGSSKFLPTPNLIRLILSYLDNSLLYSKVIPP